MKDNITTQDLETIELPNYCYVAIPCDNKEGALELAHAIVRDVYDGDEDMVKQYKYEITLEKGIEK